jgi:hypothetical protein
LLALPMSVRHEHIQRDLRSAIAIAYELRRHEHILRREGIAAPLAELESELLRIEAKIGGPRAHEIFPSVLGLCLDDLDDVLADAGPVVGDQIRALMHSVRRLQADLRSVRPVHGGTPLVGALLGAVAAVAPFVRGYAKRAPATRATQVALGIAVALTALRGKRALRRRPASRRSTA